MLLNYVWQIDKQTWECEHVDVLLRLIASTINESLSKKIRVRGDKRYLLLCVSVLGRWNYSYCCWCYSAVQTRWHPRCFPGKQPSHRSHHGGRSRIDHLHDLFLRLLRSHSRKFAENCLRTFLHFFFATTGESMHDHNVRLDVAGARSSANRFGRLCFHVHWRVGNSC